MFRFALNKTNRARPRERLLRARSSLEEGHMPTPGRPTHIQTYRRFPQRTFILSDLHTFTPPYRAKPKIGAKERGEAFSILDGSFFLSDQKNEPQKKSPGGPRSGGRLRSVAERIETRPRCGLRQRFVLFAPSLRRLIRRTAQGREVQHVNP
jgi:hypothetical protein